MIFLKLLSIVHERSNEERGAVATEYAVLLALIAVAMVVAITALGDQIIVAIDAATDAIT